MKKLITVFSFTLTFVLVLSSCGKSVSEKDFIPEKSFTVRMKAQKDGKSFEADIICLNSEDITVAFTYPKELSGFSVKTEGDGYKINVFGLADEVTGKEINNASLLNVLMGTIKTAVFTNHGHFSKKDGIYTANLTIDGIPVTVAFSEDGFLQKISSDSLNFSAQFEISG